MNYASPGLRLVGFLIDGVILGLVIAVFQSASAIPDAFKFGASDFWISVLVIWIYYVGLTATFGASLGKMVLGMRVVSADGKRAGFVAVLMREIIGKAVSGAVICIGFIVVLFGDKHRGWHDVIAGTSVVKT